MNILKFTTSALLLLVGSTSFVYAGVVYDAHGNEGYDTAAECDAAIRAGTAKFYESFTTKPPLRLAGEASVKVMKLSEVSIPDSVVGALNFAGNEYSQGACDIGAPHKGARDGVAKVLQGKYVPFSPNMEVNVYADRNGNPVRITMRKCDNWFGAHFARPLGALPMAVAPPPAPVVAPPAPVVVPEPVVIAPPVVAPPVVVPPVAAAIGGISPWWGLGALAGVAAAVLIVNNNNDSGSTGTTGTTGTTP